MVDNTIIGRMLQKLDEKLVCDGLDEIWRMEADLASELRKEGIEVPRQVRTALDGAKIMINLCRHHPRLDQTITGPGTLDAIEGLCVGCCGRDIVARIACELRKIEDMLIIKAFNAAGQDYAMNWQKKSREVWERVGPNLLRNY